jgi:hypothetical protein
MADWEMHKKIPIQVSKLVKKVVSIIKTFARLISTFKTYECPIVSISQEFAFVIPHDAGDDLLVQIRLPGGNRLIKGLKRLRFRQQ